MKDVALFYLTDVKYGGFASYTAHLMKALRQCGHTPSLLKVGKRTETRMREFMHGELYANVSLQDACSLARTMPSLIVCAYWKGREEVLTELLGMGVSITVHDPTEFNPELLELAKKCRVVAIREPVRKLLEQRGLDVRFIPHPYVSSGWRDNTRVRIMNAVAISRVDFDKHTELIAEANAALSLEMRVSIYGFVNRMYEHHKLKAWPAWRDQYRGVFSTEFGVAVRLAQNARYMVDMSVIAGDGGGTQYTFLEAIDGGAQLVVHRKWMQISGSINETNAVAVETGAELVQAVSGAPDESRIENARSLLGAHAPEVVVPHYEELWAK